MINIHTTQCIDEGESVLFSDHIERNISKCDVGDNIFHDCDRNNVKKIINVGVASAFIIGGYGDNNFMYYHSCKISYIILRGKR